MLLDLTPCFMLAGFTYRGLTPHKFTPMPGVHISFHDDALKTGACKAVRFHVMKFFIVLLVTLLFSGCGGGATKRSGDFTAFLIVQLQSYDTEVAQTDDLPVINATWEFQKDKNGFVISVQENHFADIDVLFQRLYGSPHVSTEKNLDGFAQRVYRVPGVPPSPHIASV